jgi:glycosyltransferase involved in cell wall biosynthesis
VRVAIVVPGGVDRSGRERVVPALLWLVERLASRHETHVFALAQEPAPGDWPLLGAAIHNLGLAGRSRWPGEALFAAGRRLARGLDAHGPFDVVHAFWANNPGFLATRAARVLGIPAVVSLAGGELAALPDIGYGGQLHFKERLKTVRALRGAARVTAGSRFLAGRAAGLGVHPDLVPLGADAALFSPGSGERREPRRLVHVASLNAVKDQPTLLRAFRRVLDELPDARLDVVGEDVSGGEVGRLSDGLGLSESVTFHGFVPSDRLVPLLRRASLLVQSSCWEAQGVAVLEAALAGIPAVGTAVGLVSDLAPDAAVAVPPRDPVALADAVLGLLGDPARRAKMGLAARDFARAHDADATAAAFESIYRELSAR